MSKKAQSNQQNLPDAPTQNPPAPRRSNPLEPFRHALAQAQSHFRDALPSTVARYLTPERITKITLAALSRNRTLMECTPESVLKSVMEAVSLGLEPSGGALGHAYLVPYRNGQVREAQLIIGYRGFIDLARRSGLMESVEAHCVYERDDFEIEFGREPKLVHRPCMRGDPGPVVAAYVVATMKGGEKHCEFMTRAQIDAVRNRSRASGSGPWMTDYDEMARKTVVRRAAKYWPLSSELVRALDLENSAESGQPLDTGEQWAAEDTTPPKPKQDRLAEQIAASDGLPQWSDNDE